ncbi:MAG: tripartite tricarboxylate transporter substrate binding protein [Betaproteobacteria bacterium]
MKAFVLGWLVASLQLATAQVEHPDAYPKHPIHLVVPFPAGGAADIVARVIAKPLGEALGQPVLVDNKPGADGAIAAEAVAKSAPDGYTLFFATYGAMSAVPAMRKQLPYEVLTDFTPVISAGKFAFFLFAHPSVPANTLAELIAYVHQHPGELNYASGNTGAIVATAELATSAHLAMNHIPYKGEVPAMNDFLAGRVQLMFATPANALPWVKEGKLKALVTLQDQRSALLPSVPTMAESGMKNLSIVPWAGVFGPAKMPVALVQRLNAEIGAILKRPDVESEFAKQGFEAHASSPAELAAYAKEQLVVWRKAIQLAGIEPE